MVESQTPTLASQTPVEDAIKPSSAPSPASPATASSERKALFDSIVGEDLEASDEGTTSAAKTFFAGLLWAGYAVAIVVAVVLVWSTANGLLKVAPR